MRSNRNPGRATLAFLMSVLVSTAASGADSRPRFQFEDVAKTAGIDFQKSFGARDLTNIVEDTGGGCAFFDYDGDGLVDLYFANGCFLKGLSDVRGKGDPSQANAQGKLYRNQGDGTLQDVTLAAGLARTLYGMGCAVGDYDGDGYPDLYVTCYGPNRLFRNRGDGTFEETGETARAAGIDWPRKLGVKLSVGASFLDYDRDGNLDLFVGNYLAYDPQYHLFYPADAYPGPMAYSAQPDMVFRNDGDGRFTDATIRSGVAAVPPGRSMGLGIADVDGDGWIDVYVANDKVASFLYMNQRDGTFKERAAALGCANGLGGEGISAMAVEFGDLDHRGALDLYVTAGGYGALYRNEFGTKGRFRDVTTASGTAASSGQYVGWGGGMYDVDNDGWLDLLRFNGDFNHLQPQEDLLFAGVGGLKFEDVSPDAGPYYQVKLQSRGAAFADYDRDGLIDFAVVTLAASSCLVKNRSASTGHWLRIEPVGVRPRDPVGLKIRLTAQGKTRLAMVRGGSGYLCQSERTVHFGLGSATRVDRVEILWDRSPPTVLENVPVDRVLRVVEPSGTVDPGAPVPADSPR